ncbi:unnamed protein product, partial [marine sediment metagenome]
LPPIPILHAHRLPLLFEGNTLPIISIKDIPATPPAKEYAKKRRIKSVRKRALGIPENRIMKREMIKIPIERKIAILM